MGISLLGVDVGAVDAHVVLVTVALLGATQEGEGAQRLLAVRAARPLVSKELEFLFNCGKGEKEA